MVMRWRRKRWSRRRFEEEEEEEDSTCYKTTTKKPKRNPKIELINQAFGGPSQPLGIISGLKETFTKRYIVERTNRAEIRLE